MRRQRRRGHECHTPCRLLSRRAIVSCAVARLARNCAGVRRLSQGRQPGDFFLPTFMRLPPRVDASAPTQAISFSRCDCIRGLGHERKGSPPNKRGGGAPTGASFKCPRHARRRYRLKALRARSRATLPDVATWKCFGRARLSALRRGTCRAN
jgi:hypothetical protein